MPTLGHTLDTKTQTIEFIIVSLTIIIMLGVIYKFGEPQNGPNPHEHVSQGLTVDLGEANPHMFSRPHLQKGITFPFELLNPMHNTISFFGLLIQL